MADFKWHLTSEETPEVGKGNYIIIGPKSGMYFAIRVSKYGDYTCFVDSRGLCHYTGEVKAWAKIPPLEVSE